MLNRHIEHRAPLRGDIEDVYSEIMNVGQPNSTDVRILHEAQGQVVRQFGDEDLFGETGALSTRPKEDEDPMVAAARAQEDAREKARQKARKRQEAASTERKQNVESVLDKYHRQGGGGGRRGFSSHGYTS